MSEGTASGFWRAQATVKLVGRRRDGLTKLAAAMAPGASPIDAIDRAIDLALAEADDNGALEKRLDAIEDTLEAMEWQRRADAAKADDKLAAIAASLASLQRLIAEASASDDDSL